MDLNNGNGLNETATLSQSENQNVTIIINDQSLDGGVGDVGGEVVDIKSEF